MYVQVATTSTSTAATSTRTSHQAPQTATFGVSSLLTAALAGLILVTPIWPVSGLEAGGAAPISLKNRHAYQQRGGGEQCPLIAKKRDYLGLL
jgi:hypothetical protein